MICARNWSSSIPKRYKRSTSKIAAVVVRALEICLLTGKSASAQSSAGVGELGTESQPQDHRIPATGVFVFRDRKSFTNESINEWKSMFERGVIEEVRAAADNECDCVADDRFARNSGIARWKKIAPAVHRGNSAGDSPLRQKTVDLVSAAN